MDNTRIKMIDDVIEYFVKSALLSRVKEAEKAFADPVNKALLDGYRQAQSEYQETRKYGRHHPDLKTTQKTFQTAKAKLYSQPFMQEYLAAYQALQTELDALSSALASSISPQISMGHYNVRLKE